VKKQLESSLAKIKELEALRGDNDGLKEQAHE
jgi:hypothetical protein